MFMADLRKIHTYKGVDEFGLQGNITRSFVITVAF